MNDPGEAIAFHAAEPAGKIAIRSTKKIDTPAGLSLAYTPGVAEPCRVIASQENASFQLTARGNLVGVLTNGTAVLGLGNLGPCASKPVMEGKAALFKELAGIDAFDIEIDATSVDEFVGVARRIAPTFGAINLEDIRAPECFEIEQRLIELLDIPVMHDDQHGTAIAILAALRNACAQTGRTLESSRIVINGAGAAGLATAHLLVECGAMATNIQILDIAGALHAGRRDALGQWAQPFAHQTDIRTLAEAIVDADIFIGLSAKGVLKPEYVAQMAPQPIILAMANPDPEIMPDEALATRGDAIVATGRSDFPNQINNLLVFPYIFRGALDARATRITPGMKFAAIEALASIGGTKPGEDLLPSPFDPRLRERIPAAVAQAAIADGVCREKVDLGHIPALESAAEFDAGSVATSAIRSEEELPPAIRLESDFLGEVEVPADRYFGVETVRAVRNFPVTGIPIARIPELVRSIAWIKKAAAITNGEAGDLASDKVAAIVAACDEIIAGNLTHEFVVDVIQGGAGTSTNMNANEVIANRALELLGQPRGAYSVVSPKDHVNKCQSTNDVYATAIRLAIVLVNEELVVAVQKCVDALNLKAMEFADVWKVGRTQLQDAVPMTLGQEFAAFAASLSEDIARIHEMRPLFLETNLGGSAIGTGAGVTEYFQDHIVARLADVSGLPVTLAANRIEATSDTGMFVFYSGLLKRLATKLGKIANDLRLLSSGPVGGFGEIKLPQQQPGSSIMPGKVNPVIPEMINQICYQIFGADTTVTFAAEAGQLQLNAMEPVIIWSIYNSTRSLIAGLDSFVVNCISGIEADRERCAELLNVSTASVTSLMPRLGYALSAQLARHMMRERVDLSHALDAFADRISSEDAAWLKQGGFWLTQ